MKSKLAGFSLFEFLIYLLLLSIFFLLLFQFLSTNLLRISVADKEIQRHLTNHIVGDLLERDLKSASADAHLWKIIPSQFIWSTGDQSVGWLVENKVVYRMIGTYNFLQGRWEKVSKAYIARTIENFVMEPKIIDGQVVQVHYTVHVNALPAATRLVQLCNRVIA